jgi:hypothetical protein
MGRRAVGNRRERRIGYGQVERQRRFGTAVAKSMERSTLPLQNEAAADVGVCELPEVKVMAKSRESVARGLSSRAGRRKRGRVYAPPATRLAAGFCPICPSAVGCAGVDRRPRGSATRNSASEAGPSDNLKDEVFWAKLLKWWRRGGFR